MVLHGFRVVAEVKVRVPQLTVNGAQRSEVVSASLDGGLERNDGSIKEFNPKIRINQLTWTPLKLSYTSMAGNPLNASGCVLMSKDSL